jgi:hypothetical protein
MIIRCPFDRKLKINLEALIQESIECPTCIN